VTSAINVKDHEPLASAAPGSLQFKQASGTVTLDVEYYYVPNAA
jgi:hypothetical protein